MTVITSISAFQVAALRSLVRGKVPWLHKSEDDLTASRVEAVLGATLPENDIFPLTSDEASHLVDTLEAAYGESAEFWPSDFDLAEIAEVITARRREEEPTSTTVGGGIDLDVESGEFSRREIFPISREEAARIGDMRFRLPYVITQEEAARYLGAPVDLPADDIFPVTGPEVAMLINMLESQLGQDPEGWPATFTREDVVQALTEARRQQDQERGGQEWADRVATDEEPADWEEEPADREEELAAAADHPSAEDVFPLTSNDLRGLVDTFQVFLSEGVADEAPITAAEVASIVTSVRRERRTVEVKVGTIEAVSDALVEISDLLRSVTKN